MNFRTDINGLRGIAVLAVVLFHFIPSLLPGGFAGVDIFFVISGFLMTRIIIGGLNNNNFSILEFYAARANRLIPALAFACAVLLIFGWIFLKPFDYKALGKHIGSSVSFLSNIIYLRESGYFEAVSKEKWLLHTWSLSVEWQFYLAYPIVLVSMRKFMAHDTLKTILLIGTVFGFIFCAVATYQWPNSSYYLLPARAWEMMIGGVAYLYPISLKNSVKYILELSGILLIAASCILISETNPWPGYLAIFPVLGAFFVLQAQRENSYITGNLILQKIGTWSYSIYLWHWPLVVGIYIYSLEVEFTYIGIILSIFLGFLSHKYVESIRFDTNLQSIRGYVRYKPAHIVLFIGLAGSAVFLSDGFYSRFPVDIQLKNKNVLSAIEDWDYPEANLKIGRSNIRFIQGSSDSNILFIGASHVEQTYPYVESLKSTYNVYYLTEGGCFVAPSYRNPKWSCSNIQNYKDVINAVGFDKIVTSIYTLDGHLPEDASASEALIEKRITEYDEFLRFVKKNSSQVYMLLGEPRGPQFDPKLSARHNLEPFIRTTEIRKSYEHHYKALTKLSEINGVEVIDPLDHLCSDVCPTMDKEFNYFYKDRSHMRPGYAKEALSYLKPIFEP